jgi:hypothetical protein
VKSKRERKKKKREKDVLHRPSCKRRKIYKTTQTYRPLPLFLLQAQIYPVVISRQKKWKQSRTASPRRNSEAERYRERPRIQFSHLFLSADDNPQHQAFYF